MRSERIASLGRKLGTISTNFAETFVSDHAVELEVHSTNLFPGEPVV